MLPARSGVSTTSESTATWTPPPCVMVLEDGTLVSVTAGRGNGRGEDNRVEVVGSAGFRVALGSRPTDPHSLA